MPKTKIIASFLIWKCVILIFALLGVSIFEFNSSFTPYRELHTTIPYLVWIWGNFDGLHYMEIARNGYHLFAYPFFPLFPLLIHILYKQNISLIIAALLVSNISFLISLYFLLKLWLLDNKTKKIFFFILTIFLWPTSFYLGAAYNDSLFLFFATLCIYFARKSHWVQSSFFASLATFTRLNGLALFFFILCEYVFSNNYDFSIFFNFRKLKKLLTVKKILQSRIYTVLLVPLSFISYLLYIQKIYGDWQLVFSSMKIWHQDKVVLPLQVIKRYINLLFVYDPKQYDYWIAFFELFFVFFYIFLLIYSFKKIRFSYWILFFLSILIPSLTGTFQGMPRYSLHIYPFFLSLALFLQNRRTVFKVMFLVASLFLLFLFTTLFTRGYFVA